MIIRELHLKNFGRFFEKSFELDSGINLFMGPNEAGKSTLAQFVKAMLFGMKKGRGRAAGKDAFHHYAPWNGGRPAGEMVFVCRNRSFRLRRAFSEGGELFCLDDGEVLNIADGDLKMLLGGMEEGFYEHAVSTGYQDMEPGALLSDAIEHYFLNLESTKEEQADVQSALKYLKNRRKALETEYQTRYRLRQEQMERLQNRICGYEKEAERIKNRLESGDITKNADEARGKADGSKDRSDIQRDRRNWPAEYLGAALASIFMVLFICMDHLFPAVIMAILGILFLLAGMIKDRRSLNEMPESEGDLRHLEEKIRREHLKEEYKELLRMQVNCQEQLKELWKPDAKEEHLKEEIEACEEAAGRIREAAETLVAGWGKRLEENASSILKDITEGKYYGLKIGKGMEITVTDGERILRPHQLSTGTCSQIWMSVRLAAAMFLSEEPMPLIIDDAFLSWDEERLEKILSWLASCKRQVLLFTGQNREDAILKRKSLPYSKIILDE